MYNIALKYLTEKYKDRCHKVQSVEFRKKVERCKTVREKRILYENMTDADFDYVLPSKIVFDCPNDEHLRLLVNQYYFGFGVKRDLEEKLLEMGLVESN